MLLLKQSTTITLKLGPFLDKTDGVSEETGLTPAVEVSKNGAAFAARNSATGVSHDAEGWYEVELDSTDTNTLGRLQVKAQSSTVHLPVWHEFTVVVANTYDSLISGTDTLNATLDFTVVLPSSPITDTVGAALKGQTWPLFTVSSPVDNGDGTMDIDTDMTFTNDISATTPQPILYFPTEDEDERQSGSCNVPGEHAQVTAYNTSTKVLTIKDCSSLPVAGCKFRFY